MSDLDDRSAGPSSPSWIDRWIGWVDRRRRPAWLIYLAVFIVQGLAVAAPGWLDRSLPPGRFLPIHFLMAFWTVLPLGLMHYLDRFAERALEQFRPVCEDDDEEIARLRWELGTMPAGPAALASLAGVASLWVVYVSDVDLFRAIRTSSLHLVLGLIVLSLNFALLGGLIYHTVRQLRLVSRVYARATRLDLFRLTPLYAFSGLTARTGMAWALALYLSVALFPDFLQSGPAQGFFAVQIVLVLASFAWPLVGIHVRLVQEKSRALDELGGRIAAALRELERRTDSLDLPHMDALHKMVTALAAGRDLLSKGVDVRERNLSQYDLFMQLIDNKTNNDVPSSDTLSMIKNMLQKFEIDHSTPLEALQLIKDLKNKISS